MATAGLTVLDDFMGAPLQPARGTAQKDSINVESAACSAISVEDLSIGRSRGN
jgi:hypothetical protein